MVAHTVNRACIQHSVDPGVSPKRNIKYMFSVCIFIQLIFPVYSALLAAVFSRT